ncbi:MAG: hypothetical protein IJP03_06470 [Christensenellaceae bacterium]|nr:hypothetical protein [Christensenellaceae bacterium]
MSYCVNCGVKLAPSEKKCPLCQVPVINPISPWTQPDEKNRPYPRQVEKIMTRIDRRFGAVLGSLILLIPTLLTVLCNMLIEGGITWSAYVLGAYVCLNVWVLFPFWLKKHSLALCWVLDSAVTFLYLGLIHHLTGHGGWLLPLGLPLGLLACLLTGLIMLLFRRELLATLYKTAGLFATLGLGACLTELVLDVYIHGIFAPMWSLFVLVSCLIIALLLFTLEKRNKLKEQIRRRLFL